MQPKTAPTETRRAFLGFAAALLALALAGPTLADDRDLLRFETARPYLFFILDTSASMNLAIGPDVPTPGHADDPGSRLYGAKEALFTVFENVDDVQFGFAAMNQDQLRVHDTHWLYYVESLPNNWPFDGVGANPAWPLLDLDGLTTDLITVDTDGDEIPDAPDGYPDSDIEGSVLVLGTTFVDDTNRPVKGGSCEEPLDLDDPWDLTRLDAFAKIGADGNETTVVWVKHGSGASETTYRMRFFRPGNRPDGSPNAILGQDRLHIKIALDLMASCPTSSVSTTQYNFDLRKDPYLDRFVMVDRGVPGTGGNSPTEHTAALWPWSDLENESDCDDPHPFSGKGWEGNYDADLDRLYSEGLESVSPPLEDADVYCPNPGDPSTCVPLKPNADTELSELGRALDSGDMLPFHWNDSQNNRNAILQRLAPNWARGAAGLLGHPPPL